MNDEYLSRGYKDRKDYFKYLSKKFVLPFSFIEWVVENTEEEKYFDDLIIKLKEWNDLFDKLTSPLDDIGILRDCARCGMRIEWGHKCEYCGTPFSRDFDFADL